MQREHPSKCNALFFFSMKKIFIVLILLVVCISAPAATYYVATNGSNNYNGSINAPWLTWQKGFESLSPGDTLYIRGGIYYPTTIDWGTYALGLVINNKSGTSGNMKCVFAYPGERPVFDCRNIALSEHSVMGIYVQNSNYWYLKGLEVTGTIQTSSSPACPGIWFNSCNYCIFEQLKCYKNGGAGFVISDKSEGNSIKNCDFYKNYDPFTSGDDADGLSVSWITYRAGSPRLNTVRGCRFYENSDDGIDLWGNNGVTIIDSCWSWHNGVNGIGCGFKLGIADSTGYVADGIVQRYLTNCIATYNNNSGIANNRALVIHNIYNNTTYHNSYQGFHMWSDGPLNESPYVLRNNISYMDLKGFEPGGSHYIEDHNSWDGFPVTSSDFTGLDTAELRTERKASGYLPDITSFHLSSSSSLIDTGVDVGLPCNGSVPDLGAFEFTSGNNQLPSILNQSFQIDENSPDGTVAGIVVASDPDIDQTIEYSIVSGNTDGAFTINDSTGALSIANGTAIIADFALIVKVQDNGTGYLSSQATITINIIPTGIESTGTNSTIKVYPNPVTDEVIIEIEGNNDRQGFEILNTIGNIVFKGNLSEKTIVPTTSFSPGIYYIKLQNGRTFEFKKIVKL
jgi:hypothetical protein